MVTLISALASAITTLVEGNLKDAVKASDLEEVSDQDTDSNVVVCT